MSDFVDHEMGDALQDVTNGASAGPDVASTGPKNKEASAEARAKGWAEPTQYDYSKYVGPASVAPIGDPSAVQDDIPEWAAKAAKYEWNDEYGDVGPPNADLEQMLFHSDLINRSGLKLDT
jgi:ATP-dependent RNA helicase DDX3X